ncbi:hypothetical protein CEXT_794341 [Caerostris extrusa]|uniref:Uncharacterized protein n=1 Tax=Caerostris extrusa TaxID=172846 RepID=A0AAV4Y4H8_CAEEX|nr:hypothetical protein CEXT_794341 [Caerostris extrusa]
MTDADDFKYTRGVNNRHFDSESIGFFLPTDLTQDLTQDIKPDNVLFNRGFFCSGRGLSQGAQSRVPGETLQIALKLRHSDEKVSAVLNIDPAAPSPGQTFIAQDAPLGHSFAGLNGIQ